jgi:hypothetical protein
MRELRRSLYRVSMTRSPRSYASPGQLLKTQPREAGPILNAAGTWVSSSTAADAVSADPGLIMIAVTMTGAVSVPLCPDGVAFGTGPTSPCGLRMASIEAPIATSTTKMPTTSKILPVRFRPRPWTYGDREGRQIVIIHNDESIVVDTSLLPRRYVPSRTAMTEVLAARCSDLGEGYLPRRNQCCVWRKGDEASERASLARETYLPNDISTTSAYAGNRLHATI